MSTRQDVLAHPAAGSDDPLAKGWARALGIGFIAVGAVAITAAFAATLATVVFFGVLLLGVGVAQIAHAWTSGDEHAGWETFGGILYVVTGGLIVFDPVGGAIGLTLLLAAFFLLAGAVRLALARRVRRADGPPWSLVVSGVLDLLLGALIVLGWPQTGGWVIGLFVGIELVFGGVALLAAPRAALRVASSGSTSPGGP